MKDIEKYNEVLEECIEIANEHKCISHAQIIAVADFNHNYYYKHGFNRNTQVLKIIDKNKKQRKEDKITEAVELIEKHRLYSADEISSLLGMQYNTYKEEIGAHPLIKKAIRSAKLSIKLDLRDKMMNDKSSACTIALYKLVGTKEEVDRLKSKAIDITSGGKRIIQPIVATVFSCDEEE